jgi:hypothetical protein
MDCTTLERDILRDGGRMTGNSAGRWPLVARLSLRASRFSTTKDDRWALCKPMGGCEV